MSTPTCSHALAAALLVVTASVSSQDHSHGGMGKIGTVRFQPPAGAGAAAVQPRRRAAALVRVSPRDRGVRRGAEGRSVLRDRGMGHRAEPLGQSFRGRPPAPRCSSRGARPSTRDERIGAKTPRERAYVEAASRSSMRTTDTIGSAGRGAGLSRRDGADSRPHTRRHRGRDLLRAVDRRAPHHPRQDLRGQLKAGAILERLFAAAARSPGLAHYIIHSLRRAAARRSRAGCGAALRQIAPAAPHALHMPSHTFTRLGSWQESIDANIAVGGGRERVRSRPRKSCTRWTTRRTPTCRPGRTAGARAARRPAGGRGALRPEGARIGRAGIAGVFALAAIPARYALERGAWADAARLDPQPSKLPVHRSADVLRARARRGAHRRRGDGRARSTRWQGSQRCGWPSEGGLLGRTGRDPAPRRFRVAGIRRRSPAPTPLPGCGPPPRWRTRRRRRRSRRARSLRRGSCSARCCCSSTSRPTRGKNSRRRWRKSRIDSAHCPAPRGRRRSPAIGPRRGATTLSC